MEETLRALVSVGFAMLLVLLRFDAERFAVAEHLVAHPRISRRLARRRISWYALGLGLSLAIVLVHPDPRGELGLVPGEFGPSFFLSLLTVALAILAAALVAYVRDHRLEVRWHPGVAWGIGNGVATALVDEVAFRGAVLGFLLLAGADPLLAVLGQTFLYALATRTTLPGVDAHLLVLALAVGLVGGAVTIASGGIAASFVGHAVLRGGLALLVPDEREADDGDAGDDRSEGLAVFLRADR